MITRYNTKRDASQQAIGASILMAIILAVPPPLLTITAPESPDPSRVLAAYGIFWGCSLLLLIYAVYRYFRRGRHDDVCLLSGRSLAIVRPGESVRFVRPRDISALKPEGATLLLQDGSPLHLPNIFPEPGTPSLPNAIVIAWFGEEHLAAARANYWQAMRPSTREVIIGIVLVAVVLLAALGLALAGMWREFAAFSYWGFISLSVLGTCYFVFLGFRAQRVVYPLDPASIRRSESSNRAASPQGAPRLSASIAVQRLPEHRPRAVEHVGAALLVLLGLCIFIPMCRWILSYDTIDQQTRIIVVMIAIDLTLVAAYSAWRLYRTVIRGDIFITTLLSRKTIAVVCPRQPVVYVKPGECVALVCGSNELVLKDGRKLPLAQDAQLDEDRSMCESLCERWWPDAFGEVPTGIWARISPPCRRRIAAGMGILAVGVVLLIVDNSPWGTAIAQHFIVPGAVYALYGYWCGLRGYGRTIDLKVQSSEACLLPTE